MPQAYREPPPGDWKTGQPRDDIAKGKWWEVFSDPDLNELEEKALTGNQTLLIATAHVDEARAQLRLAQADLKPTLRLDLSPSVQRFPANRPAQPNTTNLSFTTGQYTVPLDLNYEVDVFKTVRSNIAASQANLETNQALYQSVLLTLEGDVARSYFMLRGLDTDRAVLLQNLDVQKQELDLSRRRHDGGVASGLDVSQAETLVASTNADYIQTGQLRQHVEHLLAVLSGQAASSLSIPEKHLDRVPPVIPEGLPADLLERRPDIAAAERQMVAANARIGVARGSYFPQLNLTGGGGFLSTALSTLLAAGSGQALFAPLFSIPIYQAGRPKAAFDLAKAGYDESVATYREQVLLAFQDVEDSLSDLRILKDQGDAVDATLESAHRTLRISTARYEQGISNHLEVLDAERTVLANERIAAQVLGFRMVASVQLIKALGGGWQDRQQMGMPAATGATGTKP